MPKSCLHRQTRQFCYPNYYAWKSRLGKLERRAASGRIQREILEIRVKKVLQREHLSDFVVAEVQASRGRVSL
ncbi:MAG TPA: hypothetical protein VKI40_11520, partial [Terriglobales bacterium]|nr:hypothetical protein [Terriglobales bacterium]